VIIASNDEPDSILEDYNNGPDKNQAAIAP
jgi:hypothetical protein